MGSGMHVNFEAPRSHPIHKKTISKGSWSRDQLKAAFAAVRIGRKIQENFQQFHIHKATLRQRFKLNLTGGPKTGRTFTEEHERKLC